MEVSRKTSFSSCVCVCVCVCVYLVVQLCLTFCDPMNCHTPGSSVHGILQARIQAWVATPFSRASSQPRDWTQVSCVAGRFFTNWATTKYNMTQRDKVIYSIQALSFQYVGDSGHWALDEVLVTSGNTTVLFPFWDEKKKKICNQEMLAFYQCAEV